MKPRGLNNELMCRIPKHSESSINYFKEKINIYEEEVYKILEELGLAHLRDLTGKEKLLDYDVGRGVEQKWETHDAFKAGSWHYINYSNEVDSKFIPVIPIVVCMLRCSCNAQIVNLKFMMSYLVKYVTEKESRPYVNFNAGNKKNEVSVDNTNKDHVNEKISGVRIKNKEKNKHDLTNNNNVMEVCLTEVCHNVLKCNYTHCNAKFIHINTFPPEYRKSSLKPSRLRINQMELAAELDPNSYRHHLSGS